MEQYQIFLKDANRLYDTADHLAFVTYPLLNDSKLLITISQNLFNALSKFMEAVLEYDKYYKRISPYPDHFQTKLEIFKTKCMPRYSLPREFHLIIQDLKEILDEHKKSPVEFRRGDRFIIASEDYKLRTLNLKKIKEFIQDSKPFVDKANKVLQK